MNILNFRYILSTSVDGNKNVILFMRAETIIRGTGARNI